MNVECNRWREQVENQVTIVDSAPLAGRATRARMLFQTLLASASRNIHITTPYFLPDHSARQEMVRAIKERRVKVRVVTPGKHHDHLLTRRVYGELLQAGPEIYEYEPAMIQSKSMIIDGLWSVVGSTNFDNRSFGLNVEINLAVATVRLRRGWREISPRMLNRAGRFPMMNGADVRSSNALRSGLDGHWSGSSSRSQRGFFCRS